MTTPLESLIQCGTKLWLDSIDPDLVHSNRQLGATGATSNPVIVSDLIKTGRFDDPMHELIKAGLSDGQIAWELTDRLVQQAQDVFHEVWQQTSGNDGYVSFELDPLLEDPQLGPSHEQRVSQYIELAKRWSAGHDNRMIKVPATPAGLGAVEELVVSIVESGPRAIRLQKELVRSWESMPITDAIQEGIRCMGKAYESDEPRRMVEEGLAKLKARKG